MIASASYPSWVRGLKSIDYWTDEYGFRIVPFTGTGIKVADEIALCCNIISYPSWVRGLKLSSDGRPTNQ